MQTLNERSGLMERKTLTVGGHSVRRGYYLQRTDSREDNTGEPVRFYSGRRLAYLWRLVDRFNRLARSKNQALIQPEQS
mgnify:CR=1 FL=1